jgi:putative hemolysin
MTAAALTQRGEYSLSVAGAGEVREAQRLRHEVFGAEFGRQMSTLVAGFDVDEFDQFADHLIVRHEPSSAIVGTYRMMPPRCAGLVGRRFSERTFDLGQLSGVDADLIETGRSCVHPDHRSGAVMSLLWAGIGRYLDRSGHRWLGGCFWVPLDDGGVQAAQTWHAVREKHLAPPEFRVRPHRRIATDGFPPGRIPPLLRGYLRLDSWVCGEPAYDEDAGVAAFYVLLSVDQLNPRYARHFLGHRLLAKFIYR